MNHLEILVNSAERLKEAASLLQAGDLNSLIQYRVLMVKGYKDLSSILFDDKDLEVKVKIANGINEVLEGTSFQVSIPTLQNPTMNLICDKLDIRFGLINFSTGSVVIRSAYLDYQILQSNKKNELIDELTKVEESLVSRMKTKTINQLKEDIKKCEEQISLVDEINKEIGTVLYQKVSSMGLLLNRKYPQ